MLFKNIKIVENIFKLKGRYTKQNKHLYANELQNMKFTHLYKNLTCQNWVKKIFTLYKPHSTF